MKKYLLNIILFSGLFFIINAGAFIEFFHARSQGDDIKLEWKSSEEVNLKSYILERRASNSSLYVEIANILPKGNNSLYSYLDETAYKSADQIFVYRLKILENNNKTSYTSEVSVSHNISSVKRTWGSIKAMFR